MGSKTGIEWTESTWSPMKGCSRVSPGCQNCYAEKLAGRFCGPDLPLEGFATLTPSGSRWTGLVELVPDRLDVPVRWKRPRMIFVNSQSDTFHEKLSNEDIAAVFGAMAAAPQHTFQVLTKRSKRMREWFEWVTSPLKAPLFSPGFKRAWAAKGDRAPFMRCLAAAVDRGLGKVVSAYLRGPEPPLFPLPNVWLGVSVESQDYEERIEDLLRTPAAVRFLSCEPLLGPLTLWAYFKGEIRDAALRELGEPAPLPGIDWVIVGGESGSGAREMRPELARDLRDECANAGVPYFLKQWGHYCRTDQLPEQTWAELDQVHNLADGDFSKSYWPVGKKRAGSLLDGIEHKAFPSVRS